MSDRDEPAAGAVAAVPDDAGLPKDRPHGVARRVVSGVLSYGVVVLALWYLFGELHSTSESADAISLITWVQLVVVVVLGVVNLATNWPPIVIALPGLRVREAAVTNTASAALSNTVPEGGAVATGLNFAMLRSWGFSLSDITSEVVVTGTWSQMTKYILLALSLSVVVLQGTAPDGTGWVALILCVLVVVAVVVLGLILRSQGFAAKIGAWSDRVLRRLARMVRRSKVPDLAAEVPKFRTLMVGLLRWCWKRLTAAMLLSQLTAAFVLGVSCRMQGLDESTISWAMILTAFGAATFASLIVPTPGGLGVVEIVLVAVLGYGLPESDQPAVIAAVLLYRVATFLVPIPIGLVTYLYWRHSQTWRRPKDSKRIVDGKAVPSLPAGPAGPAEQAEQAEQAELDGVG
ncbi:MAG: YbhN family protein [Actinomycetes bacterium]